VVLLNKLEEFEFDTSAIRDWRIRNRRTALLRISSLLDEGHKRQN
jgi:hypothetical protein